MQSFNLCWKPGMLQSGLVMFQLSEWRGGKTSGELGHGQTTSASMWKRSPASSNWVYISLRTLPGAIELPPWLRRHTSTSTFSWGWDVLVLGAQSWSPSRYVWWRVYCALALLCGMAAGLWQRWRLCREQWKLHRGLWAAAFTPTQTSTPLDACKGLVHHDRPHQFPPHAHCLYSSSLAGGCEASGAEPPNLQTASSLKL